MDWPKWLVKAPVFIKRSPLYSGMNSVVIFGMHCTVTSDTVIKVCDAEMKIMMISQTQTD